MFIINLFTRSCHLGRSEIQFICYFLVIVFLYVINQLIELFARN